MIDRGCHELSGLRGFCGIFFACRGGLFFLPSAGGRHLVFWINCWIFLWTGLGFRTIPLGCSLDRSWFLKIIIWIVLWDQS